MNNRQELNELLHDVEPEDLIKYGLIPEFVGRLPVVAVLDELDDRRAHEDPHRAEERADQAVPETPRHGRRRTRVPRRTRWAPSPSGRSSARTGARGLRSIIEHALLDIMFDLPSLANVQKVVVDEGAISGDGKPLLIYSDQPKVASGQQ